MLRSEITKLTTTRAPWLLLVAAQIVVIAGVSGAGSCHVGSVRRALGRVLLAGILSGLGRGSFDG